MSQILTWGLTLAGVALLILAVTGVRPRPLDGSWVPLSPSGRAGITVIGVVLILVGWVFGLEGFGTLDRTAPRPYNEISNTRPPETTWDEVQTDQERRRASQPLLPTAPLPGEPVAAKPPAARPEVLTPSMPDRNAPPVAPTFTPSTAANPSGGLLVPKFSPAPVIASPAAAASSAGVVSKFAAASADAQGKPGTARSASSERTARGAAGASASGRKPSKRRQSRADKSSSSSTTVSVCEVQKRCGIDAADYGLRPWAPRRPASAATSANAAPAAAKPATAKPPAAAATVRVHDRLGPAQRREVVRLTVGGRPAGRLDVGRRGRARSTLALALPPGGAPYRLDGYTEYADGTSVELSGEGWLDGHVGDYDLRVADPSGGAAVLEPRP